MSMPARVPTLERRRDGRNLRPPPAFVFCAGARNGRDPILKERLFGLNGEEGNHGEDVKEYYFYLDSTPTHSYMKYLYKYPQAEYPYQKLVAENKRRSKSDPEFELIDTGIFNEDRYFDVFVEYAKADWDDLCIRITACNRGPQPAEIQLLPTLWFRNTWSGQRSPSPRWHWIRKQELFLRMRMRSAITVFTLMMVVHRSSLKTNRTANAFSVQRTVHRT